MKEKFEPKVAVTNLSVEQTNLALNIQYYDPKQLINTVNQSVSLPYFNLCQIFLNKSIQQSTKHFGLDSKDVFVDQAFSQRGATIHMATHHQHAAACLLMIGSVFQLLSEVLYKRYREEKRFVLQTRCAVCTAVEAMQLNALQAADRLTHHLIAKEMALYLSNDLLKQVSESYQLVPMPNPASILTRHAFMINGMDSESAILAQRIRTEILKGKQNQEATSSL